MVFFLKGWAASNGGLYFVLRANQEIDISSEIYEFGLGQFSSACSWGSWRVFEDSDNSSFLLTDNSGRKLWSL